MTVEEIRELMVGRFADPDGCHLYLWVPNRYVEEGYDVARAWGFKPGQLLTWCKAPRGLGLGGTYVSTTEFILFSRRGRLQYQGAPRCDTTWFNWPRQREHSRKPDGALDLIESVSPGPYLELFARRQRLGWDTWGNECRCDVEMVTT
jgi:N6-adenosine-specific RNA methylase IME4